MTYIWNPNFVINLSKVNSRHSTHNKKFKMFSIRFIWLQIQNHLFWPNDIIRNRQFGSHEFLAYFECYFLACWIVLKIINDIFTFSIISWICSKEDQIHNDVTLHIAYPILSMPCLLMPWLLKSPGQQQAWYWPNMPEQSVSSIRRVKNEVPCHVTSSSTKRRPLTSSFD